MDKLTGKALELAGHMSRISEDCYCAGWLITLEYTLWEIITESNGPTDFGAGTVTECDIRILQSLSQDIKGWIVFDDKYGEIFMPLVQWEEEYKKWYRAHNKEVGDRVTRQLYLDNGTWMRNDDRCLKHSPLRHGVVTKKYIKTSKIVDGPEYTDKVIDVQWDDGSTGTYFHNGVDHED